MTCETKSYKSTVMMRLTNLIGSAIFVVYGCLLPAYSTALLEWDVDTYKYISLDKSCPRT